MPPAPPSTIAPGPLTLHRPSLLVGLGSGVDYSSACVFMGIGAFLIVVCDA